MILSTINRPKGHPYPRAIFPKSNHFIPGRQGRPLQKKMKAEIDLSNTFLNILLKDTQAHSNKPLAGFNNVL